MSRPNLDKLSTGTQIARLFRDQIRDKTVLITGASPNSLGEAAAIALAGSEPGPKLLILASRTPSKLGAVAARVRGVVASRTSVDNDNPGSTAAAATAANKRSEAVDDSSTTAGGRAGDAGKGAATRVETVELDLASLGSVRAAAATIAGLTDSLDVLVNNAGISVSTRQVSPDGIELTFATNHVGPFLLTSLLLPLLLLLPLPDAAVKPVQGSHLGGGARAARRIVNVSSSGHRISPVRFSDYNFEHVDDERDDHRDKKTQEEPIGIPADELPHKSNPAWVLAAIDGFPGTVAYGASKSANILFTVALKRRLRSQGIESFAVDPGNIRTGLVREISPEFMKAMDETPESNWKSADEGCATILAAAFDPDIPGPDNIYLADCQVTRPARHASDSGKAERLWKLTEELVGTKYLSESKL